MFTLLTWARTNETRLATWNEFEGLDGPEPLWSVPAERIKMEREHLVPLSKPVVALLAALGRTGFEFPGDKLGKPISQNTMIYGCYRMGYRGRQIVHGFRGIASLGRTKPSITGLTGSNSRSPTPSATRCAALTTARSI